MPEFSILSEEFSRQAAAAGDRARRQVLEQGVPVFYQDNETGIEIMEQPDGRKFEIRYIPGAPRDRNYEIVRELKHSSAA
ncbi:MAG: hypothetical protein ACJ73N_02320 [Bryobacteraceae bacterium]